MVPKQPLAFEAIQHRQRVQQKELQELYDRIRTLEEGLEWLRAAIRRLESPPAPYAHQFNADGICIWCQTSKHDKKGDSCPAAGNAGS